MTLPAAENRFLTYTDWEGYEKYRDLVDPHARVTYDRGKLELMTTAYGHERMRALIRKLIESMLDEVYAGDYDCGGETTLPRQDLDRGLEPDECYWIQKASMAGLKRWPHGEHPAPDLVLEIDITSSSIDRMDIYATMGIPEVWRYLPSEGLVVNVLDSNQHYQVRSASPLFPAIPLEEIRRHVEEGKSLKVGQANQAFRHWLIAFLDARRGEGDRHPQPPT